jgi:hypothetical protein
MMAITTESADRQRGGHLAPLVPLRLYAPAGHPRLGAQLENRLRLRHHLVGVLGAPAEYPVYSQVILTRTGSRVAQIKVS